MTFVQETHRTEENAADWRREWYGKVFLSHKSSRSGGVKKFFSKNLNPSTTVVEEVLARRILKIRPKFEKVEMAFMNIYAPTVGTGRLGFFLCFN